MPQLDTLSYFSQFVFLLISFLFIYYFVVTLIIPNTVTAGKLRAKFNSQLSEHSSLAAGRFSGGPDFAGPQVTPSINSSDDILESLTTAALTQLAHKTVASTTVEDLSVLTKTGKQNIQSALLIHYSYVLAKKKQLVDSELIS